MTRLSSPIKNIKDHYPVVVIGSGYGGAIAASRLARAGQQVCVLERGKEFQPGEYPDTLTEVMRESQADLPERHIGSPTGLYDFRANEDIHVFVGCGLGGTSLVNANVSLSPEPRVFEDPRWPQAFRNDLKKLLEEGFARAKEMLKPTPYPPDESLPKLQALEKSANYLQKRFYRPPINVTFADGVNHVGVEQHACTRCGDCVTGCNYGAKNTVLMNYLPDARNHGAEIYTQVSVRRLERRNSRWLVHYQLLESGRETFDAPTMFVSADIVILAAGTLGSTEILLRSKAAGLVMSDEVGHRFTGNGDVLAFAYNNDQTINGVGFGHRTPGELAPVGPTITGIIDVRNQANLEDGMVIEEGAIPGALSSVLPGAFASAAGLVGKDTDRGLGDMATEKARELEGLVRGAYHGAVHNTQTYLVMTHDSGSGRMYLDKDKLRISWPDVGQQPIFQRVNDILEKTTRPLGGTFVKNPTWTRLVQHSLITVHPLGGCVMAEDAEHGVVNHKGQIFSGMQGAAVYDGLYVCDGAVIPRPLGVNPLLTISAVAERCCALIAKDRGWRIDYSLAGGPSAPMEPQRLGVVFTETMRGYFSTKVKDDYTRGEQQGREENSEFQFILTISSNDLEEMLVNEAHEARMVGNVIAPALSPDPLTVTNGAFNLFTKDPDHLATRNMRYRMNLKAADGHTYYFTGFKVVRNDPEMDVWADTTTLYITVHDGESAQGPVVGKGILKIRPDDFMRQLRTMKVTNATTTSQRLEAMARFGGFFGKALFETYGGIFAKPTEFDPKAPPRAKRDLQVGAPEVHSFSTSDGVQLGLTRYRGGKKGPVILSHGLGVSSLIFAIDTIQTNLLEHLYAHGFDVWLLDYRASIDLPASRTQFTADDIATKDYPAAVDKVRELTEAPSVQMVAHCYGSTTFFMAMLAGLQGVRSAICSQVATHIVAPPATRIKSGLHVGEFLEGLGVPSLTAYVDAHADWQDRLYDAALRLYPMQAEERCNSSVCHRITFIYAPLYEHDQLNIATHAALHEMFGVANIRSLEHLGLMVRKGHLVAADGKEVYLPHLDRLAIPIAFIHGAENACFLPESTERTFNLLCETNGRHLYARHVIPNYGHIDCIFGKNAARDVYPLIVNHLEATNA